MKKDFLTGLIILLPFTLTILVVLFVLNLLTLPFEGVFQTFFTYYGWFNHSFWIFSGTQILNLVSKLLVLASLIIVTLGIGFLGQYVIMHTLLRFGDILLHRIPFVNKVYKAAQEVVKTLFHSKKASFSQVVLVPFPHPKAYSIGLITQTQTPEHHSEKVSIFVPGTPNPTMGFMLMYKYEEIIFLDMKVDEALKFVISCGIMFPGFRPASKAPESHD